MGKIRAAGEETVDIRHAWVYSSSGKITEGDGMGKYTSKGFKGGVTKRTHAQQAVSAAARAEAEARAEAKQVAAAQARLAAMLVEPDLLCLVCGASWVCEHAVRADAGVKVYTVTATGEQTRRNGTIKETRQERNLRHRAVALARGLVMPETRDEARLVYGKCE